jgi:hypothetical protein
MSYESVSVYVVDDTPLKKPIEGVLVRVYNATNTAFHTQQATDADGHAGFTLFTGTYNLRFFKFGVQVRQPQIIEVTVPPYGTPLVNSFEVAATVFLHPVANDPRLCRASGFFRDVTGAPEPWVDIHIIGNFNPILLEGSAVLNERRALRTDKDGFACVDLIRCATYMVTIQGLEDTQRCIAVPDAPSVNLPDLLFPVVQAVSFDSPGPYTMKKGASITLKPTVIGTNGVPLVGTASKDVLWTSSDDSIFVLDVGADTLTLAGKKVGVAELRASRRDTSIIRIPNTPIEGVPQSVSVT